MSKLLDYLSGKTQRCPEVLRRASARYELADKLSKPSDEWYVEQAVALIATCVGEKPAIACASHPGVPPPRPTGAILTTRFISCRRGST